MRLVTRTLVTIAFLLALSSFFQLAHAYPYDEWKVGQPRDIRTYIDSRFMCFHFGGEEPYDKERAQEINRAFIRYRCEDGLIAKDDARLHTKYSRNPKVLVVLEKIKSEFSN